VYVDDILIFSKTLEEHKKDMSRIIGKLIKAGLQGNLKKCVLELE